MRHVLTLIFLWAHALSAQTGFSTVNLYNTQNGLSDNIVNCMVQDSRGFLWLGTREGLNRFDGYRFKKIFAENDPAAGLADNFITDMLEYQPGRILVATANGLSVLDTYSGNFENDKIQYAPLHAGSGIAVGSLFKDKSGNIWVNHSGELDVLDSNLNFIYRFTGLPWAQALKGISLRPHSMMQDNQQWLWLPGDTTGIHIIDLKAEKVYNSNNNPFNYPFLTRNFTRSLLLDETGNNLWYGHWGKGLIKYNFKNKSTEQILFGAAKRGERQSVNAIQLTGSGKILSLTSYAFFEVDTCNHLYIPVNLYAGKPFNPASEIIFYSVFHSSDDQYWLGTSIGLWQLKNEESFLRKLTINLSQANTAPRVNTAITLSPAGKLYLGFNPGGLVEIDRNRGDYHIYNFNEGTPAEITRVYADAEGRVWIGTTTGLFQFDPVTKKITTPALLPSSLKTGLIASIYKNGDGDLWVSTRFPFDVWRCNNKTGKFENVDNDVIRKFSSLGINSRISEFIQDDKKNTWMISRLGGGISRFNETNNEWLHFPLKKENKALLSEKGLDYIGIGDNDNLWLTDIFGNGLLEYYYLKDSIVKYTRNDGLPSSIIKSVCSDEKNNLWIATEYGLSLFDKKMRKVVSTVYYNHTNDGLNERLFYDQFSGNIVSVQDNEVVFFNEASTFSFASVRPKPIIEALFVNNSIMAVSGEKLRLKSFQKNITIDFTAIQFLNADKIKFAYRLVGAENEWKHAEAVRSANYSLLTPGSYSFYLKATDINGNWGPEYKLLSFTIVPQFWQTTLFKIVLGLMLIAGCWLLVRRRIKNIKHEAEMKKQLAETEMTALRSQMNPHFIFNCLNSIDNLMQNNEKEKATAYLARFARLIRAILENSKQEQIPVWKEIETLRLYLELELLRCDHQFDYKIDISDELLEGDYKIPPLVIQPFVENSIQHGLLNKVDAPRDLFINGELRDGYIHFRVSDNGIGRGNAEKLRQFNKTGHKSFGIQITRERLNLLNRNGMAECVKITDLFDEDNEATGTQVDIQFSGYSIQ